jgi:hypothetical protein
MGRRLPLMAATALSGGLLAALPAAAQTTAWNAQPVTGLYVGLGVGANWVGETSLSQSGATTAALRANGLPAPGGELSFSTGVATVGSLGWGFGNGLRAEMEFAYRYNDVDNITGFGRLGTSGQLANQGGQQQTAALMFNLLYDFQIASMPWAVPYLGAGIGMAWTDWGGSRLSFGSRTTGINSVLVKYDGSEYNFAYQAIAGVAFPIASVPGLAVTTEFRFFGTLENKFDTTTTFFSPTTGRQIGNSVTGSVDANNYNYSLMVGLRYNFGRTPPPPPPVRAAPVAAARTYLVFFDWDRADLTDRARQIIGEAATNARTANVTRIEVQGHADRSGDAAYNMRLSQRRADAVAAELVRRGVARTAITTQAFGETRPLVPTADGVREPQNRRVEIIFR